MPTSKSRRKHYRVTLGDVFEAHEQALKFGGLDGVRDLTLIESAIARPYSKYYPSLHSKAAALLQSLAKNHGFIDGNKRVALLAVTTLLDRSRAHLIGENVVRDLEDLILAVVENQASLEEATGWFKARIHRY